MMPPSPVTREQLQKRIESLQQQNRVLKVELETYKLRVKALQEENRSLRQASVIIVSRLSPRINVFVYYFGKTHNRVSLIFIFSKQKLNKKKNLYQIHY